MSQELLPFAVPVTIQEYDPPRRLWHVPPTGPTICPGCKNKTELQCIQAAGHDWHAECFRCSLCSRPLNVKAFISKDDLIFHKECYLQCFNERCAKCTQIIEKDFVSLLGRKYHRECFICERCGDRNSIQNKCLSLFSMPYCSNCYDDLLKLMPTCVTCRHPVLPNDERKEFFWQGKKYVVHSPDCYKCIQCSKSNEDELHVVYNSRLYCQTCYEEGLKKICAECNQPIFEQANKMENTYWHADHFKCSVCHVQLKPNTSDFNYGILKCKSCAADDRPRCMGCGNTVMDHGISALRSIWHAQCFKCQFCGTNCIGKKFSNVSQRPCCQECYVVMRKDGRIDKKNQIVKSKAEKSRRGKQQQSRRRAKSDSSDESDESSSEHYSSHKRGHSSKRGKSSRKSRR